MMDELANQLAQVKQQLTIEWNREKAKQALAEHHRRRVVRSAVTAGSLTFVACVAVVVAAVLIAQHNRSPRQGARQRALTRAPAPVPSPAVLPSAQEATEDQLADGSSWTALNKDTRVDVLQDQPTSVRLALRRGRARFTVSKRAERSFVVDAGTIKVQVLGTVFTVERDGQQVGVWVSRGRVSVDWPHGFTLLDKGEGGWFPPPEPEWEVSIVSPTRRGERARRHRGKPRPVKAFIPGDPAGELLQAMDLARVGGEPTRAVKLLQRFLERHPGDPRAPLAAFTLGRVLLTEIGVPRRAAAAFARARTLAPSGSLAEDALAREVEAWAEAGDLERARSRAREYLRLYPGGRRVQAVRKHARIR